MLIHVCVTPYGNRNAQEAWGQAMPLFLLKISDDDDKTGYE